MNTFQGMIDATFMSQSHFDLQRFEIVRNTSLGFAAHPFACPLLEAIQLLVDIHDAVVVSQSLWLQCLGEE